MPVYRHCPATFSERFQKHSFAEAVRFISIQIAATANDGEEALMLVEAVKPDIIIVDVCMPGYDGITFMQKVREINEEVYFIVISGHKKFEYAKSAMQYNVEDYLLKPINKEELESILRRLKEKLTQKEESVKNLEQLGSQLGTGKKKLKYYIAEQLMRENVAFLAQPIEEINSSCLTNFGDGIYQCIMFRFSSVCQNLSGCYKGDQIRIHKNRRADFPFILAEGLGESF